jgi:hypothetical protein
LSKAPTIAPGAGCKRDALDRAVIADRTSTPALISACAISADVRKADKSGLRSRMRSIFALRKAETLGFSLRARDGRTVKPEMPTMRSCSPSAYRTSVGSSVRQTMRSG